MTDKVCVIGKIKMSDLIFPLLITKDEELSGTFVAVIGSDLPLNFPKSGFRHGRLCF